MPDAALGRARLVAQGLVTRPYATPTAAVTAFGAMQGQDLPGVIASAALRTPSGDPAAVLAALDAGRLVRGYPMRGTVFLMAATDVVWVSQLCNAVVMRAAVKRRAALELDDDLVERARDEALTVLPQHPRGLSRAELFDRWTSLGVPTDKGRGYHVLAHLIGRTDLVHGPWNGADQNVVSTHQWVGPGHDMDTRFNGDRIAAVAELLRRYVTSHGPATHKDFAWWTKLPLKEIRAAWTLISDEFESGQGSDGETRHWRPGLLAEAEVLARDVRTPVLLPGFDEFILGYGDRLFAMSAEQHQLLVPGNNGVFRRSVVVDGTVRGVWARAGRPGSRTLTVEEFSTLTSTTALTSTTRADLTRMFARFPYVTA